MAAEGFATRRGRRAALLHRDEVNAPAAQPPARAAPGDHIGRRHSRSRRLPRRPRTRRHVHRHAQRGLRDREHGRRHLPARQPVVARAAGRRGRRPRRRRQGRAAEHSVLARRGARHGATSCRAPSAICARKSIDRLSSNAQLTIRIRAPGRSTGSTREAGIPADAAEQAVAYLAEGREALGVLPTQDTLVLERFFDESGGMQLVLHAPFGSRINKAWGLALRKRFCRQFNFELQAAATEEGLLLSLGPQHSFPLSDVFRYLHPATARDVLVQAFLDAPVFQTRWRWNTTISLAVPRNRNGKKVPPQLQRMLADDLMAAVFPDAAACLENIPGDRQIPDHPLVNQTVRDCLQEAMDFDGPDPRARTDPPRRAAARRSRHAGAVAALPRDSQRAAVRVPRRCAARGAAGACGLRAARRRARRVRARRARRRRDRARARASSSRARATPTNCTMRF